MHISLQRLYVRKNTSISSDGRCDAQEMRCTPLNALRDRKRLIQNSRPLLRKAAISELLTQMKEGFDSAGQLCYGDAECKLQAPPTSAIFSLISLNIAKLMPCLHIGCRKRRVYLGAERAVCYVYS